MVADSAAPGGGQNPLEPARLSLAIATGPYTNNFTEHVELLRIAGALEVTGDAPALAAFVDAMMANPEARRQMGLRARAAVKVAERLPDDTARALLALSGYG